MTTVFLSGSRSLSRLNDAVRQRIRNMTERSYQIVLGDAAGADKAMQNYLRQMNYPHVTIFCSGRKCRNNTGSWPVRIVKVDTNTRGRAFYTLKDKAMAREADYGFVMWDGKSPGSIENVLELLKRHKKSLVYLSTNKTFHKIDSLANLRSLLNHCTECDFETIDKKIHIKKSLQGLEGQTQADLKI